MLNPELLKKIIKNKFSVSTGLAVMLGGILLSVTAISSDAIAWLLNDTSYECMGEKELADGFIRELQYAGTLIAILGFLRLIQEKLNLR